MLNSLVDTLQHSDNGVWLQLITSALTVLLLVICLTLGLMLRKQRQRLDHLFQGVSGENLEQLLNQHLARVNRSEQRTDQLESVVSVIQAQLPSCLQRTSMVRYDAFDDVGGEQSFSLVLLDRKGSGFVISSVYSRQDVRIYAKAIQNGRASHVLSEEEERALREAIA